MPILNVKLSTPPSAEKTQQYMNHHNYTRGALLCLIATLAWGGMFPVMGSALTRVDPFTLTTLRYGIAGITFVILLVTKEGANALNLHGERIVLAWMLGTAGFCGFGFLVFLGQKLAGVDGVLTASIMMATGPMLSILLNWMLRKVVPPVYSMLFILISFFGVVTVVTNGDYSSLIEHPQNYGANALIIFGASCWVLYTIGASFFPKWSPYKYTAITTMLGMSSVLLTTTLLYATGQVTTPSVSALIFVAPHVLYMAFIAGFIAVLCWNFGNQILTVSNGALFMDIVPITAFTISAVQGVVPTKTQLIGAMVTGAALILNNLYMRRKLVFKAPTVSASKIVYAK